MNFVQKAEKTTAKVVDYEVTKTNKGGTQYRPIFTFKTFGKEEIKYRHIYHVSKEYWKVGDEQSIAYDPTNPQKARLLNYFGLFTPSIYLASFAFPLMVIGGGYIWFHHHFPPLMQ